MLGAADWTTFTLECSFRHCPPSCGKLASLCSGDYRDAFRPRTHTNRSLTLIVSVLQTCALWSFGHQATWIYPTIQKRGKTCTKSLILWTLMGALGSTLETTCMAYLMPRLMQHMMQSEHRLVH